MKRDRLGTGPRSPASSATTSASTHSALAADVFMVTRKDDQSTVLRAFVAFARKFFSKKRVDGN
jgi:hypothetical protein